MFHIAAIVYRVCKNGCDISFIHPVSWGYFHRHMYSICTVYVQYLYASKAYIYCTYTVQILYICQGMYIEKNVLRWE